MIPLIYTKGDTDGKAPADALRAVCLFSGTDRTAALVRYSRVNARQLRRAGVRGCVFEARSPSCTAHDAKIYSGRAGAHLKPDTVARILVTK